MLAKSPAIAERGLDVQQYSLAEGFHERRIERLPDRDEREGHRSQHGVFFQLPASVAAIWQVDTAVVTVKMLDSPIRADHPGYGAHAQVEEQVDHAAPAEWPMDMKVQQVVRLADEHEDESRVGQFVSRRKRDNERRKKEERSEKSARRVHPVGWMRDPFPWRPGSIGHAGVPDPGSFLPFG